MLKSLCVLCFVFSAGADSTDGLNGVGSTVELRSTLASGRPPVNSGPVLLRPQRSRFSSRPVSMPVERLLSERNRQNSAERENAPATIQEVTESEKTESRYKSPFVHTHTLRRTWDKQYRHYDVTPRTAMIVANLPPPAVPTPPPQSSCMVTIRPFKAPVRDSSTEGPIAFRAPRTLQPPPGTFYNPPAASRAKPAGVEKSATTATALAKPADVELRTASSAVPSVSVASVTAKPPGAELRTITAASPVTTATVVTMVSMTIGAPVATLTVSTTTAATVATPTVTTVMLSEDAQSESGSAGSSPPTPSSTPEDLSPTEAKPVFQRQRISRRPAPPELERREAHFV